MALRGTRWHLSAGDRLMGNKGFPWQRHDHTLLSWPLLAAAVFLSLRLDTATLASQWQRYGGELPLTTVSAVALTLPTWLLVASWRGPQPGQAGPLQVWWRRLSAPLLAAVCCLAVVVLQRGFLPREWSNGSAFALGLGAVALLARLLAWRAIGMRGLISNRLARGANSGLRGNWTSAGLATRLDQLISFAAPILASVATYLLVYGQAAREVGLLALMANCLGLISAWRMRRTEQDHGFLELVTRPFSRTKGIWLALWTWCLLWILAVVALSHQDLAGLWGSSPVAPLVQRLAWDQLSALAVTALVLLLPLGLRHLMTARAGDEQALATRPAVLGNVSHALALILPLVLLGLFGLNIAAWTQGSLSVALLLPLLAALLGYAWLQHNWLMLTAAVFLGWLGMQESGPQLQQQLVRASAPQNLGALAAMLALSPALVQRLGAWPKLHSKLPAVIARGKDSIPLFAGLMTSFIALGVAWLESGHRQTSGDLWAWLGLLVGPALTLAHRCNQAAGGLERQARPAAHRLERCQHLHCRGKSPGGILAECGGHLYGAPGGGWPGHQRHRLCPFGTGLPIVHADAARHQCPDCRAGAGSRRGQLFGAPRPEPQHHLALAHFGGHGAGCRPGFPPFCPRAALATARP